MPQPPQGEGPPLEWCYADARTYRWLFGISAALFIIYLTARDIFDSYDTWWFTGWVPWAIVAGVGIFMVLFGRTLRISAGADWLMDRKVLVKTYELHSVTMEKDLTEGDIILKDRTGNQVGLGLGILRINEQLWDLVYNGIRHSVANGAEVNRMAVERLSLYDVLDQQSWLNRRFE